MSTFVGPDRTQFMYFVDGKWSLSTQEFDQTSFNCSGTARFKLSGEYPLPQPTQNPIAVLTGSMTEVISRSDCDNGTYRFDEKFTCVGE